jgi:hypothetical protein
MILGAHRVEGKIDEILLESAEAELLIGLHLNCNFCLFPLAESITSNCNMCTQRVRQYRLEGSAFGKSAQRTGTRQKFPETTWRHQSR